jgi:ADP-heptose:LPS heptosyltransferase
MRLTRWAEKVFIRNALPALEKFLKRPLTHPSLINFKTIERILVIRSHDHLSDYLLSTPALRALREHFPKAHIALAVRPRAGEAARFCEFIDELLVYPERGGWATPTWRAFLRQLRQGFDLAVVLNTVSHSLTSDLLAHYSRSKHVLGSAAFRFPHCSRNFFYDLIAPYWDGVKHHTDRNLDLMRHIGVDTKDRRSTMTLLPEERAAGKKFLTDAGVTDDDLVVAMHIGAGKVRNRWHPENFAAVASRLQKEFDARVVAVWDAHEQNLGFHFLSSLDFRPILAKGLSVRQIAAILANCRLFIGNDSGTMQVAAAVKTPLIAIFGANDPEEWKPVGDEFIAIRAASRQCADVGAEQVVELLKSLLAKDIAARRDVDDAFDISDKVFKQYVKALKKP